MYINPFVGGVIATLFAELLGIVGWALIEYFGNRREK